MLKSILRGIKRLFGKSVDIKVKPFDLIFFKGNDFVGKMISKISKDNVEKHERKKNGLMWTHVGIVVDKSILPLDCLEDDKLYIYESILSGTALGIYTYSRVMSLDHPLENIEKECHSGPQLRPLYETCEEAAGEIGIARMTDLDRQKIYSIGLENIQKIMLELHDKYKEYGYPFNVYTQVAAANNTVYKFKEGLKEQIKKFKAQRAAQDSSKADYDPDELAEKKK
jgi:hypothetical protein